VPRTHVISRLCAKYPQIGALYEGSDVTQLTDLVEKIYDENGVRPGLSNHGPVPPEPPKPPPIAGEEPRAPRRKHPITKLKLLIPSTRERLTALRKYLNDVRTSDPKRMGEIASNYWGKIWKKQDTNPDKMDQFLEHYSNKINPERELEMPTLEDMEDSIVSSGYSATGPDGIPFNVYKVLLKWAAPLFFAALQLIVQGVSPDEEFNFANLVLLPKRDTFLPEDTRPISINNTDSRIIAKAIVWVADGAAQALIGPEQKGFLAGRRMTDHIPTINSTYYKALAKKQQHYILFMDTAKAFDSIHHEFIHKVLIKQGWPEWFRKAVKALMHNVQTYYPHHCPRARPANTSREGSQTRLPPLPPALRPGLRPSHYQDQRATPRTNCLRCCRRPGVQPRITRRNSIRLPTHRRV
jgi:hypothetical protein